MSWHQGAWTTTAAGSLLAVLDTYLPANPYWSIHDAAAGTNAKVYECQDDKVNCHFFVKVDDNYTGYAIIELWEGWNETTHVGTGRSKTVFSGTSTFRIYRPNTSHSANWFLSVQDHHFKFIKCGTAGFCGTYIGRPKLFDETQNTVVFCGEGTTAGSNNNLAYFPNSATGGLGLLFNFSGQAGNGMFADGGGTTSTARWAQSVFGQARVEEVCIMNISNLDYNVIGFLEGVLIAGDYEVSLGAVYHIDGVPWLGVVGGEYSTLVRMG